jgi:hypothetical protein
VLLRHSFVLLFVVSSGCFRDSPDVSDGDTTHGETDSSSSGGTSATTLAEGESTDADTDADTDTTSTTREPTTDDTDTGSSCPPSMQCLAAAPPDWSGPFVLALGDSDETPDCPTSWPDRISSVHDDLQASPAACSCACTPPSTACMANVERHLNEACTLPLAEEPFASGACIDTAGTSAVVVSATTPPTPPPCDAVVNAEVPTASWGTTASLCSPATRGRSCDDGVCAPSTEPDALLCIAREGEHPCPDKAYASSRVFFGGALDERECSDCTCGPALNVVCDGTSALELFDTPDCSGPSTDASLATCEAASASARYVAQDLGECFVVQDSLPSGIALATDPLTVCCTD